MMVKKDKMGKLKTASVLIAVCILGFYICQCRNITSGRLLIYFGVIFLGMGSVFFLVSCRGEQMKLEYLAIVLIMVWGILIGMVLPCGMAPDEKYHYMSSYEYSNRILGTSSYDEIGENGEHIINVRRCDYEKSEDNLLETHQLSMNEYRKIAEYDLIDRFNGEMVADTSCAGIYPWYKYIPSTIGITFARLVGLGKYGVIFMGRLFNLLFFSFSVFMSIRIIPKGKIEILFFALIPFMTELAGSYSYDAVLNSLVILFVASCLYYIEFPARLRWWSVIVLFILYLWFVRFKGVYIVYVVLLCYALVKRSMLMTPKCKRRSLIFIGGCGLVVVVAMAYFIYTRNGAAFFSRNLNIASPTGKPEETFYLGDFIERPKFMLAVIWDGIHKVILSLIASNNTFAWVPNDSLSLWGITICIILLLANEHGEKYSTKTRIISWICIISACVFAFFGCLFAWTPAFYTEVWGMQPRYFLPAIFLMMVMYGSNQKVSDTQIKLLFLQNVFIMINVVNALRFTMK